MRRISRPIQAEIGVSGPPIADARIPLLLLQVMALGKVIPGEFAALLEIINCLLENVNSAVHHVPSKLAKHVGKNYQCSEMVERWGGEDDRHAPPHRPARATRNDVQFKTERPLGTQPLSSHYLIPAHQPQNPHPIQRTTLPTPYVILTYPVPDRPINLFLHHH